MSRIFITGDTHGDIDIKKLNSDHFDHKGLTADDYVIVCGDMGVCWDGGKQDAYIQKWWNNKPWTTLFIDGNHENHPLLNSYPIEPWKGGKVHRISDKLIHLMRGQIFTIADKTFFTFGGADSIDKMYRKEGLSWWPEEMPNYAEMQEGLRNLDFYNDKVDYIITHCGTDYVHDYVGHGNYMHDKLTNYLWYISTLADYKHWFCGHYHEDMDLGERMHLVYNTVIEVN